MLHFDHIILSYLQVAELLRAKKEGKKETLLSLDLELTRSLVFVDPEGVVLPDKQRIGWDKLEKIYQDQKKCYLVEDNNVQGIVIFSEETHWVRTLFPTKSAPTTLISGSLMHRIKDIDPWEDTKRKILALEPLQKGIILDTATGLGYTAIQASVKAERVTTIDLDPTAIEIAKLNPWSKELFNNFKIHQIVGDVSREVKRFKDGEFTHILHDPPNIKIGGDLYSGQFYQELFRVLKRGGRLFHYIGNPDSDLGAKVTKGVVARLQSVGFVKIEKKPETFGLTAMKS